MNRQYKAVTEGIGYVMIKSLWWGKIIWFEKSYNIPVHHISM